MNVSPDMLKELTGLIREWTGLSLGPDKAYLVRHRLGPVVRACGLASFEELMLRLRAAGGRATAIQQAIVEAITTKETSFFRDEWLFDALQQNVLPERAREARQSGRRLRILSAGSSTGQEAFTLAMILREMFDSAQPGLVEGEVDVLAVDISNEAVEAGRLGVYSKAEAARGLSELRLRRHFQPCDPGGWKVVEPVRRLVQFRSHNLLRPASTELGRFDLVLCRNVLIYFDDATRTRVCRSLNEALVAGGCLVLGSAESLQGTGIELEQVKFGRAFVYRKQ